MNREIGYKWYPQERSLTRLEILEWLKEGREFVKKTPIIQAPLALTAAYWLVVPGLYLWYRPLVFRMYLLDYGDLGIQEN